MDKRGCQPGQQRRHGDKRIRSQCSIKRDDSVFHARKQPLNCQRSRKNNHRRRYILDDGCDRPDVVNRPVDQIARLGFELIDERLNEIGLNHTPQPAHSVRQIVIAHIHKLVHRALCALDAALRLHERVDRLFAQILPHCAKERNACLIAIRFCLYRSQPFKDDSVGFLCALAALRHQRVQISEVLICELELLLIGLQALRDRSILRPDIKLFDRVAEFVHAPRALFCAVFQHVEHFVSTITGRLKLYGIFVDCVEQVVVLIKAVLRALCNQVKRFIRRQAELIH